MKLPTYIALLFFLAGSLIFTTGSGKTSSSSDQTVTYNIIGLPQNILENVQSRLKASDAKSTDQIEKEIILAIQPYGYFHSEIFQKTVQQGGDEFFQYDVRLGPALHIIQTEIKIIGPGENNKKIQQALKNTPLLKKGAIFTTMDYNKTHALMFSLARSNGYINAEMIRHEVYVNLEKNEATVFLTLNTGLLFYFGPITFSSSPYNISFLERFVPFRERQVYSPDAVKNLQENLLNSKYFSSASASPQLDKTASTDEIPVLIDTQAVKSQQYNFGVGYGTNTGARTSIGMDFYRMTDTGHHLSTLLNLSTVTNSIMAKYYIPGEQPYINQYVIGGYYGEFKPQTDDVAFTEKYFAGYETKLNKLWSSSSNINYLHERFSIDDSPYHTTDLIYPSFNLSRLSSNNAFNPEEGSRITLDASTSVPGTEEEFLQSELSGKWIYPPTKNNFVILRGNLGTTYADDYSDKFPLSMRFFAGGYNSVRGYAYESLGPGKYLKVGSAEIQQRIYGQFFTGIFLDEGNASDSLTQPLERGVGIDFIYRTSVGPLSIYIAQASTEPDKPLSIEFNFGANL